TQEDVAGRAAILLRDDPVRLQTEIVLVGVVGLHLLDEERVAVVAIDAAAAAEDSIDDLPIGIFRPVDVLHADLLVDRVAVTDKLDAIDKCLEQRRFAGAFRPYQANRALIDHGASKESSQPDIGTGAAFADRDFTTHAFAACAASYYSARSRKA